MVSELEQHQRRSLVGGQPVHVFDDFAELLTTLDLIGKPFQERPIYGYRVDVIGFATGTELGQAAVARDRVQPGAQHNVAIRSAQRTVRGDKGELQRVLRGLVIPQHMQAKSEYSAGVAIVDRLEGGIIAGANVRHQTIIRQA